MWRLSNIDYSRAVRLTNVYGARLLFTCSCPLRLRKKRASTGGHVKRQTKGNGIDEDRKIAGAFDSLLLWEVESNGVSQKYESQMSRKFSAQIRSRSQSFEERDCRKINWVREKTFRWNLAERLNLVLTRRKSRFLRGAIWEKCFWRRRVRVSVKPFYLVVFFTFFT